MESKRCTWTFCGERISDAESSVTPQALQTHQQEINNPREICAGISSQLLLPPDWDRLGNPSSQSGFLQHILQ